MFAMVVSGTASACHGNTTATLQRYTMESHCGLHAPHRQLKMAARQRAQGSWLSLALHCCQAQ